MRFLHRTMISLWRSKLHEVYQSNLSQTVAVDLITSGCIFEHKIGLPFKFKSTKLSSSLFKQEAQLLLW